ncbi:50S ribosomal protein L11 methyltransferase [Desulforhopalus singaporensis]|uniref:Ribosomal protein L11 methyltransferase n=1 Tax=Desulforhopalus singaporensis TaxID=91360 RepID=A0A1H0S6H6_9BACT|nr:50S ribosomal protein L11 methyltransferase [Desulforhopalus singaporensis]SDP37245.1 [LSU ribosomal protein L11P]-lysine N-methyltransferase [Desulforhopalus singaporensis]
MEKKHWLKVTVKGDPLLADPLCDFAVGILGAGVETGAVDEPGYGIVNCYLEVDDISKKTVDGVIGTMVSHLEQLQEHFRLTGATVEWEILQEEDWGKNWKKHFTPFEIIPGFVIAPTWERYDRKPGELVVVMDPGMAFGTGHHATTTLSLGLIREVVAEGTGKKILDVGTGTGVLAMGALLFDQSATALALDNDPQAVDAARENASLNGLADRMEVSLAPVGDLDKSYDVVVANIVHDVLVDMADHLVGGVGPGGVLILSGILVGEQLANIVRVFTAKGLEKIKVAEKDEWAAVCFARA